MARAGQCSNNITIIRALAAVYQGIRPQYWWWVLAICHTNHIGLINRSIRANHWQHAPAELLARITLENRPQIMGNNPPAGHGNNNIKYGSKYLASTATGTVQDIFESNKGGNVFTVWQIHAANNNGSGPRLVTGKPGRIILIVCDSPEDIYNQSPSSRRPEHPSSRSFRRGSV